MIQECIMLCDNSCPITLIGAEEAVIIVSALTTYTALTKCNETLIKDLDLNRFLAQKDVPNAFNPQSSHLLDCSSE